MTEMHGKEVKNELTAQISISPFLSAVIYFVYQISTWEQNKNKK